MPDVEGVKLYTVLVLIGVVFGAALKLGEAAYGRAFPAWTWLLPLALAGLVGRWYALWAGEAEHR